MYLFLGYIKEVLIQEKYFSNKSNMLKKNEPIKIIYVRMVKEGVESEEEHKGKED